MLLSLLVSLALKYSQSERSHVSKNSKMHAFRSIELIVAAALLLVVTSAGFGQTPTATPDDDRPVKITTSLIQLDVQVTGNDGKPVKGLTEKDFSVYQDGKLQQISAVTFVDEASDVRTEVLRKPADGDKRPVPPPSGARSNQGRIITFVLDDGNCLATLAGTAGMRDAVRRFIADQMLPDDKVAIYRTAGGASLLQAYTSNKELLRRLANKISLLPSRACGSTFEALRDTSTIKVTGSGAASFESEADKVARADRESRERRNQVVGTIGVLSFVVDRLKNIPQRKTIFLLSEGVIADVKDDTFDRLRELADKAARSSVVIHTMSNKGVSIPGMILAQDEVLPGIIAGSDNITAAVEARSAEERSLSEGLSYLAGETGGRFIRSSNRLETDVERILTAQAAYYLIAYEPDEGTFKGKAFHRIQVRTTDDSLTVSSRKGFYGRSDVEAQPVYKTPDSPLFQALAAPFSENGLDVRLTLLFGRSDKTGGSFVRALFHVPGEDLALMPDGAGKKTSLDIVAVILDEKGKVVDEFNRTYPIKVPQQGIATVNQNGFDFSTDMAVKKPGIYTFRIAVRNNYSKRLGSAGDIVDIPDMKDRDLRMTGLITTVVQADGLPALPIERPINAAFAPVFSTGVPAVRRYPRGSSLAYAYHINNAKTSDDAPILTKTLRLFKDGKEIAAFPEAPITALGRTNPAGFGDYGVIRITDAIQPGEYVLQVIVRDKATSKSTSQWVDFEVVN